jgi:hypothetical protein
MFLRHFHLSSAKVVCKSRAHCFGSLQNMADKRVVSGPSVPELGLWNTITYAVDLGEVTHQSAPYVLLCKN